MDQIDHALAQLIESKTAAEEQSAAEQLMELVQKKRSPLKITVFDTATGHVIPLNKFLDDPKKPFYVELSIGTEPSLQGRRWVPKQLENIYILLRE